MKIDSICGELVDYRGSQGEQCIIMDKGYITSITEEPRGKTLDYRGTGHIIIPGLIDLHVHLRGLQLQYKGDEATGTLNALKSGITLVVDMPNTKPYLNTREALLLKLEALRENSYTDYGVYAGIPHATSELERITELPIAGFKAYPRDLEKTSMLEDILSRGHLLIVHSEDPMSDGIEAEDLETRASLRNCYIETLGLEYLQGLEGRIHITHASCPTTIREAKTRGYTVDTTPHHLLLDNKNHDNCLYKVNPPLRDPQTREGILRELLEGRIDALASDHAPHAKWEKADPLACRPGITWLPHWPWIIYRALVAPGLMKLEDFLYMTSRRPAEILGLENYGHIEPGARANLVVLDPSYKYRYHEAASQGRNPVYHWMREAQGQPVGVIVGGHLAFDWIRGVIERSVVANAFGVRYSV